MPVKGYTFKSIRAPLVAQTVNNLPAMQEIEVWSLGWKNPQEKRVATHSSILAWRIPRTEEPGKYSPWGCEELDATERLTYTKTSARCFLKCVPRKRKNFKKPRRSSPCLEVGLSKRGLTGIRTAQPTARGIAGPEARQDRIKIRSRRYTTGATGLYRV